MAIINTDRFLVQRAGKSYRVEASDVVSLAGDNLQTATDRGAHTTHNIGVGGTPGNAAITLSNTGRGTFNDSVYVQEPGGDPAVKINLTASTGEILTTTNRTDGTSMIRIQDGNGADVVGLAANGNAVFQGNVAIGKSSATAKLDIDGKAKTSTTLTTDDDNTLTTKNYVDAEVTAGTTILGITGGDGITATTPDVNKSVTISSDYNTNKGLGIDTGKLVTKLGAGLEFDSNGKIAVSSTALNYKGTVDLTSATIPASPVQGDSHGNTTQGDMSSEWQTALSLGATTVAEGDLVIYNGTAWTYIPTGGVIPPTDLSIDNHGVNTLDVASSTGDDVTLPAATTSKCGLMTKTDKARIDSLYSDQSTLGDGKMWIGNASGVQTAQTLSGDLTVTNAGVTTIKTSVALAGSPTTTTQAAGTNDTTIATTQFVTSAVTSAAYVEKAGDNMTGNLTFGPAVGTKTITLNQTTGGANFNGAVGIGTDSPVGQLHVNSPDAGASVLITSGDSNSAALDLGKQSDPDGGRIVYDAGDNLLFSTRSSERLRIKNNGNVGIGTDSPDKTLHVKNSALNPVRVESTGAAARIEFVDSTTTSNDKVSLGSKGDDLQLNSGGTPTATLKANGSVGIGTDSPVSKLQVKGGDTYVGDNPNNGNAAGVRLREAGYVQVAMATATNSVFTGYTVGSNTKTSDIRADGTATFAGDITPSTDGGCSLGTTTKRFANVYTQDMHFSNEGTEGNSIDGTTGDWTLQEGADHLYFINNKTGMKFRVVMEAV